MIDAGENGLLVDNVDNPERLADAMALLADRETLQHATRMAERRRGRFTLERMADETEQVYFDVLGRSVPAPLHEAETAIRLTA